MTRCGTEHHVAAVIWGSLGPGELGSWGGGGGEGVPCWGRGLLLDRARTLPLLGFPGLVECVPCVENCGGWGSTGAQAAGVPAGCFLTPLPGCAGRDGVAVRLATPFRAVKLSNLTSHVMSSIAHTAFRLLEDGGGQLRETREVNSEGFEISIDWGQLTHQISVTGGVSVCSRERERNPRRQSRNPSWRSSHHHHHDQSEKPFAPGPTCLST